MADEPKTNTPASPEPAPKANESAQKTAAQTETKTASSLTAEQLMEKMTAMETAHKQQLADLQTQVSEGKEAKKKLADLEAAQLAEQGKFKELYEKEIEARKNDSAAARRSLGRAELKAALAAHGAIDPDIVKMFDLKELQYDDATGEFTNIADLVTRHKEAKPHLYKAAESKTAAASAPSTGDPKKIPDPSATPTKTDVSKAAMPDGAAYNTAKQNYLRSLRMMH